jgi:hypothetical protein
MGQNVRAFFAAGAFLLSGAVYGGPQTLPYAITNSDLLPDVSPTLVFGQFDPALGTLSEVRLTVTYDGLMSADMVGTHDPNGDPAQLHVWNVRSRLGIDNSTLGVTRGDFAGLIGEPFCWTYDSGPAICQGSQAPTNINNLPLELFITDAAFLAQWIGLGTISIAPYARWSSGADFGSPQDDGSYANWRGTVAVSYVTGGSSIPEPATFALLGIGLAGIAASRRRHAREGASTSCRSL